LGYSVDGHLHGSRQRRQLLWSFQREDYRVGMVCLYLWSVRQAVVGCLLADGRNQA
jgi:hypothetical protein